MLYSKICIEKPNFGKRKRQLQKNNLVEKENYSFSTEKKTVSQINYSTEKENFFCRKKLFLAENNYQQKNRYSLLDRIRRANKINLGKEKNLYLQKKFIQQKKGN